MPMKKGKFWLSNLQVVVCQVISLIARSAIHSSLCRSKWELQRKHWCIYIVSIVGYRLLWDHSHNHLPKSNIASPSVDTRDVYEPQEMLRRFLARSKLSPCWRNPCQDSCEPEEHEPSLAIKLCKTSNSTSGTVVGRPWAH